MMVPFVGRAFPVPLLFRPLSGILCYVGTYLTFLMAFLSIAVPSRTGTGLDPRTPLCAVFSKAFEQLSPPYLKSATAPACVEPVLLCTEDSVYLDQLRPGRGQRVDLT